MDTAIFRIVSSVVIMTGIELASEAVITSWDPEKKEFNVENIDTSNFLLIAGIAAASGLVWELGLLGVEEHLHGKQRRERYNLAKKINESEYFDSDNYVTTTDY